MSIIKKAKLFVQVNGYRALVVRGVEAALGIRPVSDKTVQEHIDLGAGYVIPNFEKPDAEPGAPVMELASDGVNEVPVYDANDVVTAHYRQNQPLRIFSAPGPRSRLNLVTDSINAGSLFGGVGTAILLAVQLAKARNSTLRVVTRTQVADEAGFRQVLRCNGIEFRGNVEFSYVGVNSNEQLDVCPGDRFLTTSWWTTESVLGSIAPDKVDYLLQEDERMFYAHGDEWVRCNEVLKRDDIRYILNTRLLYEHMIANGLPHLREKGIYFEPSFPRSLFYWDHDDGAAARVGETMEPATRKLFFYARPTNLRNMYYRGVEALDRAIVQGIIDTDAWDIVFVGKDAQEMRFSNGARATVHPTFAWKDYGEFIRSVDLGFILMSTPHPSYPPLDIASSGGAVVTNRFGSKQDLSRYSDNIIMADLGMDQLVEGLRRGVALAESLDKRKQNYDGDHIDHDWVRTFEPVVEAIK